MQGRAAAMLESSQTKRPEETDRMTAGRQPQIERLLLNLLPADGSTLGNAKLFEQVHTAAMAAGL